MVWQGNVVSASCWCFFKVIQLAGNLVECIHNGFAWISLTFAYARHWTSEKLFCSLNFRYDVSVINERTHIKLGMDWDH